MPGAAGWEPDERGTAVHFWPGTVGPGGPGLWDAGAGTEAGARPVEPSRAHCCILTAAGRSRRGGQLPGPPKRYAHSFLVEVMERHVL